MSKEKFDTDKAVKLKDELADVLCENEAEVGVALSVLMSMFITTAMNLAEIPPHHLIRMVADAICKAQDMADAQDESEGVEWLN